MLWGIIFILAGLKNIDEAIYESAKIDGAGWFVKLFKITLPMIKNVLLFVLVADTTTNLLLFAPMQLLTEGGPQGSTNVLMYEGYKSAFMYVDRPRSAAIVTILLLMIGVICMIQFKLFQEKDEHQRFRGGKREKLFSISSAKFSSAYISISKTDIQYSFCQYLYRRPWMHDRQHC